MSDDGYEAIVLFVSNEASTTLEQLGDREQFQILNAITALSGFDARHDDNGVPIPIQRARATYLRACQPRSHPTVGTRG